jgi:hypothetical protein
VHPQRRSELVQRYLAGPSEVDDALADISEAELDARSGGEWTVREIVHHLGDSEMRSAIRLRQLLAEDDPVIAGYDEGRYARVLFYDRPIEASLDVFRAARASTGQILERLSDAQWERTGTHTEVGAWSVEMWLETYAAHGHDHADQIRRARG